MSSKRSISVGGLRREVIRIVVVVVVVYKVVKWQALQKNRRTEGCYEYVTLE